MKYLILICSLLLVTISKAANGCLANPTVQDTKKLKYCILSFNQASQNIFDKACSPTKLSSEEIKQIDSLIRKKVREFNKNAKSFMRVKRLSRYYKQFIPALNSSGEKEVWVNCFCSINDDSTWRNKVITVLDGGSCYFQLKINLTKKTAYDFGVNGVA